MPSAEAIADFPRIISKLKQFSNTNNITRLPFWAKTALENNPSAEQNPEKFLSSVRDERLKAFRKKDEHLYQYVLAEEQDFNLRWKRIQNFWLNIVFECVFFSGLILFSLWPWLRRKGVHAWCVHLSLMPLLLFLPYYLGYCGWTFTSAGPSGGILYPLTIFWFRDWLFWTPIDQWLIVSSPKILAPISQDLGPMISVSGGYPLGITALLLIGCVIYACVWAIAKLVAFMVRPKSSTN